MDDKDFVGRNIQITQKMRLLIPASAVQITFGLPKTIFLHFRYVFVYPHEFTSRSGARHKGEVNPRMRAVVLSWKHFEKGISDPEDGVVLGLHEMAHALWLEDGIPNYESEFLPAMAKKRCVTAAKEFLGDGDKCNLSIFRNYGCSNTRELFAVAVEHFFERPEEFVREEPDLYWNMAELLKQNPCGASAIPMIT